MATYLGTLRAILELIDSMSNPSIKKLRKLIDLEIKGFKEPRRSKNGREKEVDTKDAHEKGCPA